MTQPPRRSGRTRSIPERYGSLVRKSNDVLLIEDEEPIDYKPTDYKEALNSLEKDK